MKVKRFEAPDTKSALALVKEELGHEAVILSTRNIAPAHGQGRRSWVEVVAAVDFEVEEATASLAPRNGKRPTGGLGLSDRPADPGRARHRPAAGPAPYQPPVIEEPEGPAAGVNLSRQARLLQQRFGIPPLKRQESVPLSESPTPAHGKTGSAPLANRPSASAARAAHAANVTDPARATACTKKNGRPSPEEIISWRNQILEQLSVRPLAIDQQGAGPLIIALVGPTGVGKTTTAAKLAAWFTLHENAKVALLSMDCYRIGATDQLRTYARIMRLPCEIAMKEQDLQAALHKHRDRDLIIIDTAGKSPFDEKHIPELTRWFAPHGDILPYLVLSATAKKEDIQQIINTYRPLGVPAAILTKLDETRAYAALCQQMAKAELPIACLCTGQKVPEDFLPASKEFLKTLFGEGWDSAMDRQQEINARDGWLA